MINGMKSLVLGTLWVAVSMSHAASVTIPVGGDLFLSASDGSGRQAHVRLESARSTLYFSNGTGDPVDGVPTTSVGGAVATMNLTKATLGVVDGAILVEGIANVGAPGRPTIPVRGMVSVTSDIAALAVDDHTGEITRMETGVGVQWSAAYLSGVLDGGQAVISNLSIDLAGKRVFADVLSNAGTASEFRSSQVYLWDFTSSSGPAAITAAAVLAADPAQALMDLGYTVQSGGIDAIFSASHRLDGLKLTQQGLDFFTGALGMSPGTTGYTTLASINNFDEGWGSIKVDATYSLPLPEPSTYALMGLGLVGVMLASRRASRH